MSLTMSQLTVPVFVRGLKVLATLLKKGEDHAARHGMAPAALLDARLAADMLPLAAQIQRASDTSKFAVQRIGGGDAPRFADDEATFGQLQERIAKTIDYIENADAARLDAGGTRPVTLNWGATTGDFNGASYLLTVALPNFYFHVVTAYDILRHRGVQIGKLDFLGTFEATPDLPVPGGSASGLALNNVAIAVRDLPRMVAWYERVLGLTTAERGRFDAVGADYAMLEGAGTRIELVTIGSDNPVPVDRSAAPHHLGVLGYKALVFDTHDLPARTTALADQGVEFVWADQQLTPRRRSTMIRDPEGNMIHFFGPLQ